MTDQCDPASQTKEIAKIRDENATKTLIILSHLPKL